MKKDTISATASQQEIPDLSGILTRITDGFIALDGNGHCHYLNKKASELLQLDPAIMTGQPVWPFFPDGAGRPFYKACQTAMIQQQVQCLETPLPSGDRWVEYHVYPSPSGLSILLREITARRKAEQISERAAQQLLKEKEISESIINSLPGVFFIREPGGKILKWNKHLETISGYSGEEIAQLKELHFIQEEDKDRIRERVKKLLAEGSSSSELVAVTKDGKKIPFYITGRVIQFEGKTCMMIIGLDMSERKRTEEELHQANEQLHHLSAYLQNVREEERKEIAREIHDELGQQLTGLKMDISWASSRSREDSPIRERLTTMDKQTDQMIATVRRISSELRPSVLDDLGLSEALDWQSTEFEKRFGIETRFEWPREELNPGPDLVTGIFRIYQESLTNIARHAKAKKVASRLAHVNNTLILQITDDGIGFDTEKAMNKGTFGLLGIKERTLMMGGTCDILSSPGIGTTIAVSVPCTGP